MKTHTLEAGQFIELIEILSKRATAWQARNAWSREKRRENARLFPGSRAAILSGTLSHLGRILAGSFLPG